MDKDWTTEYRSIQEGREDFYRLIVDKPIPLKGAKTLQALWLDTPLGPMIAVGDEDALYLLEFVGRRGLEREIERLRQNTKSAIIPGETESLKSIKDELGQYFEGKLTQFKTPLFLCGTPFQKQVWHALIKIPFAQTCSYRDIAKAIGKPTAYRAVALANGANQIAIVIPCHRVINTNGDLGGYGGGIGRKEWLLKHEAKS
jgi:AraC family transcriptional regulator of adaptative response/methylated-DNA-[protein]-cysteine methyltransferase